MKISCLSIFPEIIGDALSHSIPGKARERGIFELEQVDIRDFAGNKHNRVDDIPYGGGVGMVFKPEPVAAAIKSVYTENSLVIHPSPAGKPLTQEDLFELSREQHLIFIASRYEGLDQRIIDHYVDREYSIGDFVISGGELAVAMIVDGIVRLLPGALGKEESFQEDSFVNGLLDYPHYTRPPVFENIPVPAVLRNGNHEHIRKWRKNKALQRTKAVRPDLLEQFEQDKESKKMLANPERYLFEDTP